METRRSPGRPYDWSDRRGDRAGEDQQDGASRRADAWWHDAAYNAADGDAGGHAAPGAAEEITS